MAILAMTVNDDEDKGKNCYLVTRKYVFADVNSHCMLNCIGVLPNIT